MSSAEFIDEQGTSIHASIYKFKNLWVIKAVSDEREATQFEIDATASIASQNKLLDALDVWLVTQMPHTRYEIVTWAINAISELITASIKAKTIKPRHPYIMATYNRSSSNVLVNMYDGNSKKPASSTDIISFLQLHPDTVIYSSLACDFIEERLVWYETTYKRMHNQQSVTPLREVIKALYWKELLALGARVSDKPAWEKDGLKYNQADYKKYKNNVVVAKSEAKRLFTKNVIASHTIGKCGIPIKISIYQSRASWIASLESGKNKIVLEADLTLTTRSQESFWHELFAWVSALDTEDKSYSTYMAAAFDAFKWIMDTIGQRVFERLQDRSMTATHPYIACEWMGNYTRKAIVCAYRNGVRLKIMSGDDTRQFLLNNPDTVIYPSRICSFIEENYLFVDARELRERYFNRYHGSEHMTPVKSVYWHNFLFEQRYSVGRHYWVADGLSYHPMDSIEPVQDYVPDVYCNCEWECHCND